MKRFSFFLAVFSVGLLLFLLLTGQFGQLTGSGRGGGEGDGAATPAEPPPAAPSGGEKRITYQKYDYDRGRLQYELRGAIEGSSEMRITSNPEEIGETRALRDAEVEIPLYPSSGDTSTPEDVFVLGAERVEYVPSAEAGPERVRLEGTIHGEGSSGSPRFDTRDVDLTIRPDESSHLAGTERVQIEYPAVTLRGQKGFSASIGGREGLDDLVVQGPLVVALSAGPEGSVLGFRGGAMFADGAGGEASSRVHLYSEGPMRVDPAQDAAEFEGRVLIYQVAADTSLEPPAPADIPEHRFACERLRLELDPVSRRITRLVARRVTEPVVVHLADGYRVEGDELVWSDGDQEGVLTGDVRIRGDLGEFRARTARIRPEEGVCWLDGGIEARVRGDALARGDGEWERRIGGEWVLGGESAELRYSRAEEGHHLDLFRAIAAPGERVTIREDRPDGALLLGGEMVYDPNAQTMRVLRGDAPGALRPEFHEGRSRGTAERIDLALVRPALVFEGAVDIDLVDPPVGEGGGVPAWLSRGPDSSTRIAAERVRLGWDAANRLERIEAWRGADPVSLEHRAEETFRLVADEVIWDGPEGLVRAEGPGSQTLTVDERAEIVARTLSFSVATWAAEGHGEVRATVRPAAAAGEAEPGGTPRGPVTIEGDHVTVALRPPPEDGTEARPAPAADRPAESRLDLLRSGDVLAARGWSDAPGTLRIEEGSFRASGDTLDWDAVAGVVRLHGAGRQKVFHVGPEGLDELTADAIEIRSDERRLVLEGETRARIHQGSIPSEETAERGALAWDVSAGSLVAHFAPAEGADGIALTRVIAAEKVVLVQADSEIEFRGDRAEWDAATERLRVHSEGEQGLQTLHRGRERRDEIVAREILLVRPELGGDEAERIEVLFIDVLSAVLHIGATAPDDPRTPDSFTLRADNLLLGLTRTKERVSEALPAIPVDEARAWGDVDFRGGEYRVHAHRAMFRRATKTLHFQGGEKQKVTILLQGQPLPPSNELELRHRGGGWQLIDRPAGGVWTGREIERALELFDREDRRDAEGQ